MLLAMGVGDRGGGQSARPQQSNFDAQEKCISQHARVDSALSSHDSDRLTLFRVKSTILYNVIAELWDSASSLLALHC